MNSSSESLVKGIQYQLANDYLDFFSALQQNYPVGSTIRREADAALVVIQHSLRLTGRLLGAGSTIITKNELKSLEEGIKKLNQIKSGLIRQANNDTEVFDSLAQINQQTGISPDDLQLSARMVRQAASIQQQAAMTSAPKRPSNFDRVAALGAKGYASLGILSPLLGPYTSLVSLGVYGVGKTLGYGIRGGMWGGHMLGRGITSAYNYAAQHGSMDTSEWGNESLNEPLPSPFASAGSRAIYPPIASMAPSFSAGSLASGPHSDSSFSASLFDFWNRKAFDAGWTKELLQQVKSGVREGAGNEVPSGRSSSGLLGFFKSDFLKGALGIGAGLLTAAGIDSLMNEFFPEEWQSIKSEVEKGFESFKSSLSDVTSATVSGLVGLSKSVMEGATKGFSDMWVETFSFMENEVPGWRSVFGDFSNEISTFFQEGKIWSRTARNVLETGSLVGTMIKGWWNGDSNAKEAAEIRAGNGHDLDLSKGYDILSPAPRANDPEVVARVAAFNAQQQPQSSDSSIALSPMWLQEYAINIVNLLDDIKRAVKEQPGASPLDPNLGLPTMPTNPLLDIVNQWTYNAR